ncbi:terminase gpA endonuclease subunit [Niveibacterium sp.]|uniref:terminase gpA endonuclease subunit n=1 Tax=Niveibacterium sp. TaxID=2017444 RepID=UPI0035B2216C
MATTESLTLSECPHDAWAKRALDEMMGRVMAELAPREPLTYIEWAEKYRRLSAEENPDFAGEFRLDNTPILRGILAAIGDPKTRRVIVQKSAQIGYTAGVVCTVLGYHAHWRPCVSVAMFPRIQSAKDFAAEKLDPMIKATDVLAKRISLKSRADGNSTTRKRYAGGMIKLVASNSPADVKSTSARVRIVEEPDDTNKDVKGQGNAISLLRERGKTIRRSLELIGGTPTAKGASEIEKEMRTTDQRRFMVACHHCGEKHEIEWEHVVIPGLNLDQEDLKAPDIDERFPEREIYGRARFEDAYYACPHCGAIWSDEERCENIRAAASVGPLYGWEITNPSANDPGFYCNELQSCFEGSFVPRLAEKYLRAKAQLDAGDPNEMVAFWNSTRGLPWEYKGELPEEDELRERAEDYQEWSVPAGGIEPVLTVDVQHDRLAVTCWVVGRGDEMWLSYWGELYGQTVVAHQGAWIELEQLLDKTVQHATGAKLPIVACGIDCSDGQTSDAAYAFVRKHNRVGRQVLALKGAPDDEGRVEIWTPPKAIDPSHIRTKAARWGLQINIVGTAKAKDLLLGWATETGRVRLRGSGPGRMHWYRDVRSDFYEQLLSEIKIPSRTNPNKRRWKARTDRRQEALDCTVYALYLSRHLRLHLRRAAQWDIAELKLRQVSLLDAAPVQTFALTETQPEPVKPAAPIAPEPEVVQPATEPSEPQPPAQSAAAYLSLIQSLRRSRRV